MERWMIERSREQVVAVSGTDQQEYMVTCGFRLLETSCLAQEQVDRVSLDRTGGACEGASCGECQG